MCNYISQLADLRSAICKVGEILINDIAFPRRAAPLFQIFHNLWIPFSYVVLETFSRLSYSIVSNLVLWRVDLPPSPNCLELIH